MMSSQSQRTGRESGQPRGTKEKGRRGGAFTHRNRPVYIPDGYLVVGQISGAHANRGEIKVESHSDFPDRFAPGAVVLMGPDLEQVEILTARPHKSHILITLDGITSRDGARSLQGTWLYVAEEDAAELDDDTYWIHELLGLTVITDQGRQLGTVTDVLATGANDVYVVRAAEGVNRGQDILLPAIAQVVLDVDVAAGTITVHLLPGLLDEA